MFDWIGNNLVAFWFGVGFALLAIEIIAFGFGTGVLLFGSIGALLTGLVLWFEIMQPTWLISIATFAVASAVSTAILWAPLKKLQGGSELGHDRSSDLIGRRFRLDGDIARGQTATTRYSGNEWRVELSEDAGDIILAKSDEVVVTAVNAGVFYVKGVT